MAHLIKALDQQLKAYIRCWNWNKLPKQFQSAAGLLQGLRDGDVGAFQTLRRLEPPAALGVCRDLIVIMQPHVMHQDWEVQLEQCPPAAMSRSSSSSENWGEAVQALGHVWRTGCHLLDPAAVLEVLQAVLRGLLYQHHLMQRLVHGEVPAGWQYPALACVHGLERDTADMLDALLPHSSLVAAVLQRTSLLSLMATAVAASPSGELLSYVSKLAVQCSTSLRSYPAAHSTVCGLLASGAPFGQQLLSQLMHSPAQTRAGLWGDPLLQAACLEGARKAAAAVAGVVASRGGQGAAGSRSRSSSRSRGQQMVEVDQGSQRGPKCSGPGGRAPVAPPGDTALADISNSSSVAAAARTTTAPPVARVSPLLSDPDEEWAKTWRGYAEGMVWLLEGPLSGQQPTGGSIASAGVVAAAWQCVQSLVQEAAGRAARAGASKALDRAGKAVKKLLGSSAARQVLLQQPGGVCSLEEVCCVLEQCFQGDAREEAVAAAECVLSDPALTEVALAVPGFAAAVVKHAFGPPASGDHLHQFLWFTKAPLLEVLVSQPSGRAALLADVDTLGHLAWAVATCKYAEELSPHVAALWAVGMKEQGSAKAMVAGLAAGNESWVRVFGWVVKELRPKVWRGLPGLPAALMAAFNQHRPEGETTTPLEQVLVWLLEEESGRRLLLGSPELAAAVSDSLQRWAHPQRPSPLAQLLTKGAHALSFLAASPVLCKGALVSLATCQFKQDLDSLLGTWVEENEEVQQQVLQDRGLLCALLRALAAGHSAAGVALHSSTASLFVLLHLPKHALLPQLVELLAGVERSSGSSPTAAAAVGVDQSTGALQELDSLLRAPCSSSSSSSSSMATGAPPAAGSTTPDVQLVAGAWLALERIRRGSKTAEQQVLAAMQQQARKAERVHALQQVEAAGHAAWVAAAQARQGLTQQQQLLQRERASIAAEKQLLQREREALQAERQQLEQLRDEEGRQRKRRQL